MNIYLRIDKELADREKTWVWLGEQIHVKPSTMGNWKERGVPTSKYEVIADALNKSMDWMYCRQSKVEWPFSLVDQDRYFALHPDSKGAVQLKFREAVEELERLEAENKSKQLAPNKASRSA